jgi:hypothetical protein
MNIRELYCITGKCKKCRGCQELCHFSVSLGYVSVFVRVLVFSYFTLAFTVVDGECQKLYRFPVALG